MGFPSISRTALQCICYCFLVLFDVIGSADKFSNLINSSSCELTLMEIENIIWIKLVPYNACRSVYKGTNQIPTLMVVMVIYIQ